jgi:SAM-dependent methyltransferase
VTENRDHAEAARRASAAMENQAAANDDSVDNWGMPAAGEWRALLEGIADRLLDTGLKLEKVFDAACGSGLLVQAFRKRGVQAFGGDSSSVAVASARRTFASTAACAGPSLCPTATT